MKKLYVNELSKHLNEKITFEGFVDTIRDKKWVMFVILRDSKGKIQMTIEKSDEKNVPLLEIMSSTTTDSVIKVEGTLKENEAVKLGGMELIPDTIEVVSKAEALPFDYNNLDGVSIDTRLDYRFLDLRKEKNMTLKELAGDRITYIKKILPRFIRLN